MRQPLKKIYITQNFGEHPEFYEKFGMKGHNGIDYRAPIGTEVYAAIDGKVKNLSSPGGYGEHVKQRNRKFEVCYAHLKSFAQPDGKFVKAGGLIGISGESGYFACPHLHFGIRELGFLGKVKNYNNGYYGWLDPLLLLEEDQERIGILEIILNLFRTCHKKAENGLIVLPQNNGQVFFVQNGKKRICQDMQSIIEALVALHAVGVSNDDADKIPDGKPL